MQRLSSLVIVLTFVLCCLNAGAVYADGAKPDVLPPGSASVSIQIGQITATTSSWTVPFTVRNLIVGSVGGFTVSATNLGTGAVSGVSIPGLATGASVTRTFSLPRSGCRLDVQLKVTGVVASSSPTASLNLCPPAAPTDLKFASVGSRSMALWWQDNSDDETQVIIYRAEATNPFREIDRIPGAAGTGQRTYFPKVEFFPSTQYCFYIAVSNANGSSLSNQVCERTKSEPAAPTNLRVTLLSGSVYRLAWNDNTTNEDRFSVEYKAESGDPRYVAWQAAFTPANQAWYDVDLRPGATYFFSVRAWAGPSSLPGELRYTVATTPPPPSTVTSPTLYLEKFVPFEGNIAYATRYPAIGSATGNVISIKNVESTLNGYTLTFPKTSKGYDTRDCNNMDRVVWLPPGYTMTPTQMAEIYGTATPAFPVTVVACAWRSDNSIPEKVAIQITYR